MAITTRLHDGTDLGEYHTLAEALQDIRTCWMEGAEDEDADCQGVLILERGRLLATCLQDQGDAEVCHTMYCDGTMEHHRCKYILDAEGGYERTEVTDVTVW